MELLLGVHYSAVGAVYINKGLSDFTFGMRKGGNQIACIRSRIHVI